MLAPLEPVDPSALEKTLKQERLITIGRLISSVVHEINNPLQAIRGALALALDDLENPRELREYITISQQEVAHIIGLLNQVRLIYRSQSEQVESFQIHDLFQNSIDLTREETMRQKVRINDLLPSQSLVAAGVYNHIYIVVLRTILALTDAIGTAGGGELAITAEDTPTFLHISLTAHAPLNLTIPGLNSSTLEKMISYFDLAACAELVKAGGGRMEFHSCEDPIILRIDLPKELDD
jgi:nitrogen-specific signal transduction histidine kinase